MTDQPILNVKVFESTGAVASHLNGADTYFWEFDVRAPHPDLLEDLPDIVPYTAARRQLSQLIQSHRLIPSNGDYYPVLVQEGGAQPKQFMFRVDMVPTITEIPI